MHDRIRGVHFGKRPVDAVGKVPPILTVNNTQCRSQDVLYFQERQLKSLFRPRLNKGAFVETRPLRRNAQCEHKFSHTSRQRPFACVLNIYVGKGFGTLPY